MKTVILTGGTGFLGNWVLRELLSNGCFVYVVVRPGSKRLENLNDLNNIKVIELNMDEIHKLQEYVPFADTFYHLAWEGERHNFSKQTGNIQIGVNAFLAANSLGVSHFICVGSQAEYGICHEIINEKTIPNPNNAYGISKLSLYNILSLMSKNHNLPLTWVRVFSVYGPLDNPNTLISYLINCFKKKEIAVLTSGIQKWDFLFVTDAAKALFLLGAKKAEGLFNLAYGESRTIKEFVLEAREVAIKSIGYEPQVEFSKNKASDGVELIADISKISSVGFEPEVSFSEGIKRIIDFDKRGSFHFE